MAIALHIEKVDLHNKLEEALCEREATLLAEWTEKHSLLEESEDRLRERSSQLVELEEKVQEALLAAQQREKEAAEMGARAQSALRTKEGSLKEQMEAIREAEERLQKREVALTRKEATANAAKERARDEAKTTSDRLAEKERRLRILEAEANEALDEAHKRERRVKELHEELNNRERQLDTREAEVAAKEASAAQRWCALATEADLVMKREREWQHTVKQEERRIAANRDAVARKERLLAGTRESLRRTLESVELAVTDSRGAVGIESPATIPVRASQSPPLTPSPRLSPPGKGDPLPVSPHHNTLADLLCITNTIRVLAHCWTCLVRRTVIRQYQRRAAVMLPMVHWWNRLATVTLRSKRRRAVTGAIVARTAMLLRARYYARLREYSQRGAKKAVGVRRAQRRSSSALLAANGRLLASRWLSRWAFFTTGRCLQELDEMDGRLAALEARQRKCTTFALPRLGLQVFNRDHTCDLCRSTATISYVEKGGVGAQVGLEIGDVIARVGETAIRDATSISPALAPPVQLLICRTKRISRVNIPARPPLLPREGSPTAPSKAHPYSKPVAAVLPLSPRTTSGSPGRSGSGDYALSPMSAESPPFNRSASGASGRSVSTLSLNLKPPPPVEQVDDLSSMLHLPNA
eukprot:Sspe_Gene.93546::Locus_66152_Transcript_9_10_Confidence_0.214_Length_3434::g.93546::m.93546